MLLSVFSFNFTWITMAQRNGIRKDNFFSSSRFWAHKSSKLYIWSFIFQPFSTTPFGFVYVNIDLKTKQFLETAQEYLELKNKKKLFFAFFCLLIVFPP